MARVPRPAGGPNNGEWLDPECEDQTHQQQRDTQVLGATGFGHGFSTCGYGRELRLSTEDVLNRSSLNQWHISFSSCSNFSISASSGMELVFNYLITDSELAVELQRHGTVRCRSSRAQGSSNHRAFGDFLARRARGLGGFYVHFDAVGALS